MKIFLVSLLMLLQLSAAAPAEGKKLILVFIEMEFCPWCHKMASETLEDKKALKMLEKEYILARITLKSGDIPLFLKPKYFPTSYILSSDDAKVIDELPGYMEKTRFLDYLHTLYEVENEPTE